MSRYFQYTSRSCMWLSRPKYCPSDMRLCQDKTCSGLREHLNSHMARQYLLVAPTTMTSPRSETPSISARRVDTTLA